MNPPVGLLLPWDEVPRTVFYDRFLAAVRAHPSFTEADPVLLIPAEDTSQETNWPRYGDPDSAWVRRPDPVASQGVLRRYLEAIVGQARAYPDRQVLVVNMHPFARLPLMLAPYGNILVADGSLSEDERARNPRTLSMPALPMVKPAPAAAAPARTILASFRGGATHPVRQALAGLHDGREIVVNLVGRAHVGRIDAVAGRTDADYESLLDSSVFAFVPRGDALFSYRLLEVLARGAIPVILSDGWVLPFDRTLDWSAIALRVPEAEVADLPARLRRIPPDEIARLQAEGRRAWAGAFDGLERVAATLLAETAQLLAQPSGVR